MRLPSELKIQNINFIYRGNQQRSISKKHKIERNENKIAQRDWAEKPGREESEGGLTCWSAGASFLGGSPGYLNNSIRRAGWNTVRTRWNTLERPKSANTFKLEVSTRMVSCQIDSVNPVCRSELGDEHLKFDSSVCSLSFCRWSVTSTNQNKVNRVQTGAFSSAFDRWPCKRNPCSARVTSQFQYSCSTLGSYQLTMTRGGSSN